MSSNLKVLFFIPHPDDLEFGASLMCINALRLGYSSVVEVLMTNGEYGTKRNEFKGKRLARIRRRELKNTVKVYEQHTGNRLKIIRMGFIDGHLPLNKAALNKVLSVLEDEKPHIIFAPDPWYAMDIHPDHLNTGRLTYFALKELRREEMPKRIFFFYSFRTNVAIKCRLKDITVMRDALSQHRSQISPRQCKMMVFYTKLAMVLNVFKNKGIALRFRELKVKDGILEKPKKMKRLSNIIRYVFYNNTVGEAPHPEQYLPKPKDLGLI